MDSKFINLNSKLVPKIPVIGVGTYLMTDEKNLKNILEESFKIGYRLIGKLFDDNVLIEFNLIL